MRAELDLPANVKIVLNVGYADLRKGFDQFVATAQILSENRDDVYFVWLGGCLLYTSPSPRDQRGSRMPSSA